MKNNTKTGRRFFAALIFGLALFSVVPEARAATCEASISEVILWTRGTFEGTAGVRVFVEEGSSNVQGVWLLCSLNEQDADPPLAKDGTELSAAREAYGVTCEAVLNTVTVAHAIGKKVTFDFSDAVFPTCADVQSWGGLVGGDSDDPSGRLGAWDGLMSVTITSNDSIYQ